MRAVIQHGLDRGQLPVKLCYAGPFFRYEKPQEGRYRQLQQVGVEAIGVDDPALDAEVIAIADEGYRRLGLSGFRLEITSLGDDESRPRYREALQQFLFGLDLDESTRKRAEINPLRVLDDKRPGDQGGHRRRATAHRLPQRRGTRTLRYCPRASEPSRRAVRDQSAPGPGLDYYTKTTFEFVHDGLGAQSGIGGGGRYDGLMRQIGGKQDLSGIGFGIGVDRTMLAMRAEGVADAEAARVRCSESRWVGRPKPSWSRWPAVCVRPASASTWLTAIVASKRDEGRRPLRCAARAGAR